MTHGRSSSKIRRQDFVINPFTFISDSQKGLVEVVESVIINFACIFICKILKILQEWTFKRFILDCISSLYEIWIWHCNELDLQNQFTSYGMDIEKIPIVFWSHAFFPNVLSCNQNQNNFAKCFKNLIIELRSMPRFVIRLKGFDCN